MRSVESSGAKKFQKGNQQMIRLRHRKNQNLDIALFLKRSSATDRHVQKTIRRGWYAKQKSVTAVIALTPSGTTEPRWRE